MGRGRAAARGESASEASENSSAAGKKPLERAAGRASISVIERSENSSAAGKKTLERAVGRASTHVVERSENPSAAGKKTPSAPHAGARASV